MKTLLEASKQALEALEKLWLLGDHAGTIAAPAILTLRIAIAKAAAPVQAGAQPVQQEPIGWKNHRFDHVIFGAVCPSNPTDGWEPVYLAAGAQAKPSDYEIHKAHCYQSPYETSCKYGDEDCPMQAGAPFTPDWTSYRQGKADGIAEAQERIKQETEVTLLEAFDLHARQYTYNNHPAKPKHFPVGFPWFKAGYLAAGAQPEGYQLVPIEPTSAMKTSAIGVEVYPDSPAELGPLTWHEASEIYKAMLAAAKEQP